MIKISFSYVASSKSANDARRQNLPPANTDAPEGNSDVAPEDVAEEAVEGREAIFALRQQLWVLFLVPVLLVLLFKPADQQSAVVGHSEWVASPSMSLRFPGHTPAQRADAPLSLPTTGLLQESYRCGAHNATPMRTRAHCDALEYVAGKLDS